MADEPEKKIETKKPIILHILNIIKENSDEYHPLSFSDVKKILMSDYKISIDRRTFWNTAKTLRDLGYPICLLNTTKNEVEVVRDGEPLYQRVYFEWADYDITNPQIYFLIDSVLASSHINANDADETIAWLKSQSSYTFRNDYETPHSADYGRHMGERVIFVTIEAIFDAMRYDCQMMFNYNDFDENGKLKSKGENNKGIIVSPYKTVMRNGHYYLICCRDGEKKFYHYRIDKITDARVLRDTKCTKIEEIDNAFDLNTYIKQHPYMFAGDIKTVRFLINKNVISALYDYFGDVKDNITKISDDNERAEVRMRVSIIGFYYWALQYGESVEILEPQELRDKMRNTVSKMARTYSITNMDMYRETIREAVEGKEFRGRKIRQNELRIDGIDLKGKSEHKKLKDLIGLQCGHNGDTDYEWINTYKKLIYLDVVEPEILNEFVLNLPELRRLIIRERRFIRSYDDLPVIKDFKFLGSCKNIEVINVEYVRVKSFEGIYDLENLGRLCINKENFDELDLSRFSCDAKVTEQGDACYIEFEEIHRRNFEAFRRRRQHQED